MGKTVKVTKVTLEYAFEGKLFTVDFPKPDEIGSIVFSKIDLARVQKQQSLDTGKAVVTRTIAPGTTFPITADELNVLATNEEIGVTNEANGTEGRSLWWHTSFCTWIHPEEDQS